LTPDQLMPWVVMVIMSDHLTPALVKTRISSQLIPAAPILPMSSQFALPRYAFIDSVRLLLAAA